MIRKVLAGFGIVGALFAVEAASAHADTTTLKIGTAAAPGSPWGQVFNAWKKAVENKTGGAVSFDFYYGSTQGSEATMVDKMKAGQLDGAALTSFGLGRIDKRLLSIQVPGVLHSWKQVDAVRDAMSGDFEQYLTSHNTTLITWGDVGYAHFLSKGFEVKLPSDLKGHSPWVYADEPIQKAVFSKIGGVNPFTAELMSVKPNLDNGKIDCMSVSALAAEMLQWNSTFDHGVDAVEGIVVGAVVMSSDSLNKLPADAKATVIDIGHRAGEAAQGLKTKIRAEDEAAWARFKSRSGVVIHTPTAEETNAWDALFKDVRATLKAGTFDAGVVNKIESIAASH